ncbi:hypothetical protein ABW20_dc0106549 [Dactylellina cionopaga]|nr:hypothetical protein ABW20_dc0106549 [Dactylellina cionopaga]
MSASSNDSSSVAHGPDNISSKATTPSPPPPNKSADEAPVSSAKSQQDQEDSVMAQLMSRLVSWWTGNSSTTSTAERDEVVEERQELGYTSTFEGNSRKRRRPTPSDDAEDDQPNGISPKLLHPKTQTPASRIVPHIEPPNSDESINTSGTSSSEHPTPSTNVTEPPNELPKRGSILEYAESKRREMSQTPLFGPTKPAPEPKGREQLARSLARRNKASQSNENDNIFRFSTLSGARINKRSATPSSMRSSRQQRTSSTPRRTLMDTSVSYFPDPKQYSPPSQLLPYQTPLRASTGASSFRASSFKPRPTPPRSARLEQEIQRAKQRNANTFKPWELQRDPDSKVLDAEGLTIYIRELQANKVDGFENYGQMQERQKHISEQIRAFQTPKPQQESLREISQESLKELHSFLSNANENLEARLIGGCPITPRNLKTLSGASWLNDEVINAYIHLVKERANTDGKLHMITMNSTFVSTFNQSGYSRVSRWAKRAGAAGEKILTLDGVIIPIHRNYHWTLAFINVKQKRFEYYDSLAGNWDPIQLLRDFMKKEVGAKSDMSGWQYVVFAAGYSENQKDDAS